LGVRALAAELAVLRRPQTPRDLLPERAVRTLPEAIIPSLTRLVATGHAAKLGGFRVYLVVVTAAPCAYEKWPSGAPWGGDRVALITVSTRYPDRFETISMGFSARELELFAIVPVGPGEYWRAGGQVLSSVVPDGVTHVTWVFRWVRHPGGERHRRYLTIHPAVHDNVAVAQIAPWETQAGATLYIRGGRVLTSKNEAADLPVCGVSSVVLGAKNPIAPWLKQHFGIFRASRATRPLSEPESGDAAGYFKRQGLGLNFAQTRFVATGTGLFGAKPGVWAVPGTIGACLIYGPPAGLGTCGARISVESGGFYFSGRDYHGHNMYSGLVPDGNRTVSIVLADGARRKVAVADSLYSLTVTGQAVALIDKDATGQRRRFRLNANANQF
jgi:hypothetical protein